MSILERSTCPICQRPATAVLRLPYADPRFASLLDNKCAISRVAKLAYEIRECSECDLLFQTWMLVDDDAQLIYTVDRPDDNPAPISKQPLHALAHNTEEVLVLRQVLKDRVPRVLDYGCGWGRFASMALAFGCEVFGYEINRGCAEFCASRGIRMLTHEQIASLEFDFINADQVFEHLADPRVTLRFLADSLAEHGLIKISVPGSPTLRRLISASHGNSDLVVRREYIKPLFPLVHVNLFSPRSLRALAATAGLQPYRPPLLTWLGAGQMWNLPRQLNRNLVVPFKRFFLRGTYLWFSKKRRGNHSNIARREID